MVELVGRNTEEKIWNFLIANGYTKAGTSGLMANLYAESGLIPNNLENSRADELGSDTYYTAAVNDKTYTKDQFVNDKAGYGLAQWTYYTRKRALYEATVEKGISIADLGGQLTYLIYELRTSYSSLNKFLKSTDNVQEACDRVLKEFERPAILNYKSRRDYAFKYYDKYVDAKVVNNPNQKVEMETVEVSKKEETTVIPDTGVDYSKYKTYKVVSNDSWWGIANKELGSAKRMNELAEFNGKTTSTMIHPGDILYIPILLDKAKDETATEVSKNYTIYKVKSGDSWWKIAQNKMGDSSKMNYLAEFNGMTINTMLHPNDELKIPCTIKPTEAPVVQKYTTHTVKKNESWWSIASEKLGSPAKRMELAAFNGKTIQTPLIAGQVIKIPK